MRMTERYAHLAPSFVADEIRRAVPTFGVEPGNVEPLNKTRKNR
jgi:hypothetical protein